MTILVLEHEADAGAALLAEAARARGVALDVRLPPKGEALPAAVGYDAVIALGSVEHVYDAAISPWFDRELDLFRQAHESAVPVLGICFGAQALAIAHGGRVVRADRPEIGWVTIESTAPAVLPNGPWLAWHYDVIEPPPGATVIARNRHAVQAFTIGPHLGVQFHPEVRVDEIERWVEGDDGQLGAYGIDPSKLLVETKTLEQEARDRAFALFDGFLSGRFTT